jgi:hypothetical protein
MAKTVREEQMKFFHSYQDALNDENFHLIRRDIEDNYYETSVGISTRLFPLANLSMERSDGLLYFRIKSLKRFNKETKHYYYENVYIEIEPEQYRSGK